MKGAGKEGNDNCKQKNPRSLHPHGVARFSKNPYEPFVPRGIIGIGGGINLFLEDPGQPLILRCQEALALDPPCPFSLTIKDQQAPAAIVPADCRAGHVDSAVAFSGNKTEERACLGSFGKNTPVSEECNLVRVDFNRRNLTGILVPEPEAPVPQIIQYRVDKTKVAATFPALAALKRHRTPT